MNACPKYAANRLELRITATPGFLCVARHAVQGSARLAGMCEDEADSLTLALEEALTNVIQHSYRGPCEKPIIITIQQLEPTAEHPVALQITIRDFGVCVDPTTIQGRDLNHIRPGGLGVHIIHSIMDEIEYLPQAEGGMLLRMIKYAKNKTDIENKTEKN